MRRFTLRSRVAFLYERDDVKRRVLVTVSGPFQAGEVITILERQREDGTWTYGTLLDTRATTGRPTIADMRAFMKLDARVHVDQGRRGPLALLATDSAMYATACVYAAIGGAKRTVEAFRDRQEADSWLVTQTGA
jgi:hypothetical protein